MYKVVIVTCDSVGEEIEVQVSEGLSRFAALGLAENLRLSSGDKVQVLGEDEGIIFVKPSQN